MKKRIIILSISIAVLSTISCFVGLFYDYDSSIDTFISINNQTVSLHQKGLYYRDSTSVAAQGLASDFITLIIGVPVLLVSIYLYIKESFTGKILLTGIVGYFLYTFISYTFLWNYNFMFLVYVVIMTLSLYGFVLLVMEYDIDTIKDNFDENLPHSFIGIYQIMIGLFVGLMWLGIILSGLKEKQAPELLEHYTTLVIQGMDLSLVVPLAIISGSLIIKRKPWGYVLSSIVIVKGSMMLLAILGMIANQIIAGVSLGLIPVVMFICFTFVSLYALYKLLTSIKK